MGARISCTCCRKRSVDKIYTNAMICHNTSDCGLNNPTNSGKLSIKKVSKEKL